MPDGVVVAIIAGSVALAVAYVNSFLAESFRRFRDGSALAASLAGELAAYEPAWPMLVLTLDTIINAIDSSTRQPTFLRPIERPRDLVFEDSVGKLGLLGAELSESVVYVYSNIRAFRVALEIIARDESDMTNIELRARCVLCKDALQRAVTRGNDLIKNLRYRSTQRFVPDWPWAAWIALFHL